MEDFFQGTFGIWTEPYQPGISTCRPVRPEKLVALIGLSNKHSKAMLATEWDITLRRLRAAPGKEGLATFFNSLIQAEVEAEKQAVRPTIALNEATTYPLPTEDDWRDATSADHDLAHLATVLLAKGTLTKAELTEKAYYEEWKGDRLKVGHGIIYRYEVVRRVSILQLRVKVVLPRLRRVVLAACHASSMAGHSSVNRTYHRVITQFWWPNVNRDVRRGVLGCACCRVANHNDHSNQMLLQSFVCNEPFSVVFLDVWQPGEIRERDGSYLVLTILKGMCGFGAGAFLPKRITSETLADAMFSTFVPVFGLPRLIITDAQVLWNVHYPLP
jgi:hypothetical protein